MWNIETIVYEIKKNRKNGRKCALLIGAGCSYQAGIPLASGFVEDIKKEFEQEFNRAPQKTYPACMAQLTPGERQELVNRYIDAAVINWAHLSIAQLIYHGFVDRVLTTNFDPLVMRACALVNVFPGIYDMTVNTKAFEASALRDVAVFHLHGMRDGFIQHHDADAVKSISEGIRPVIMEALEDRPCIVIGYSGENDPVVNVLSERDRFRRRLFWIGFNNDPPSNTVDTQLIGKVKEAHWVSGFDPDGFLFRLADELGCFPPVIFSNPVKYLRECHEKIIKCALPGLLEPPEWASEEWRRLDTPAATLVGAAANTHERD